MIKVRSFKINGVESFRKVIAELRDGIRSEIPYDFLEDSELTEEISGESVVECNGIETKNEHNIPTRLEVARYLARKLAEIPSSWYENRGMWSWLSLCFFDQLCPKDRKGNWKILSDYRLIPSGSWKDYYRHLLSGPFRLYRAHGDRARVFLGNPVHKPGEVNEQLASRQEIIGNPTLLEVIEKLYYSEDRENFKQGCTTKEGRGSIHRLVKVKNQLDLTYDLSMMSTDEIMDLLPAEFDRWR